MLFRFADRLASIATLTCLLMMIAIVLASDRDRHERPSKSSGKLVKARKHATGMEVIVGPQRGHLTAGSSSQQAVLEVPNVKIKHNIGISDLPAHLGPADRGTLRCLASHCSAGPDYAGVSVFEHD